MKYYIESPSEEIEAILNSGYAVKEDTNEMDLAKSNITDENESCFTQDFLHKLKDRYQKNHPNKKLECQFIED